MLPRSPFRRLTSEASALATPQSKIQNLKSEIGGPHRSLPALAHGLLSLALLSFPLFSVAQAASIKTVQRGSATAAAGANRTAVTLPAAVDPAKTIVWGGLPHGGGRDNSSDPNTTRVGFDLESSTVLALERLGSPNNSTAVEWQAVEFTSGVSVQRGLRSLTTTETTVNVSLPTAVDLTKSFVLVSVATGTTSRTIDEQWTIRSQLTSATNLELSRNEAGLAVDLYWQVVEMEGASVQRGLTTIPSGAASATATIASVDPLKSFLLLPK